MEKSSGNKSRVCYALLRCLQKAAYHILDTSQIQGIISSQASLLGYLGCLLVLLLSDNLFEK
jgi:hypothetical protein